MDEVHPDESFISISIYHNKVDRKQIDFKVQYLYISKTAKDYKGNRVFVGDLSYLSPEKTIEFGEYLIKIGIKVKELQETHA